MYRVNDVYSCIQGEGCLTGKAMVLVRLHGCPIGCEFCDTREAWGSSIDKPVESLYEALGTNTRYWVMNADPLASYIAARFPHLVWVLLTGGEPVWQDIQPLVSMLHDVGRKVQLETSGFFDMGQSSCPADWVTVSPKESPKWHLCADTIARADEVKMVVGDARDIGRLDKILDQYSLKDGVEICLQPMSKSKEATALCVKTVIERGWRLSLQTHKLLKLR